MTSEDQAQLQQSINSIAQILYRNTPVEQLQTLEGIEQTIGQQTQELGVSAKMQQLKISGARWKPEHGPNVLAHHCAYLNKQL